MTLQPPKPLALNNLMPRLLLVASLAFGFFLCANRVVAAPDNQQAVPSEPREVEEKQEAAEETVDNPTVDSSAVDSSAAGNSRLGNPIEDNPVEDEKPVKHEKVAKPALELPAEIRPTDYLLLPRVGDYRRGPLHVDPIEYSLLQESSFQPKAGDKVRSASGVELVWQTEEKPPTERLLIGGYAYSTFESPAEGIMLLDAQGCAALNLNGQWIAGNPYGMSVPKIPVNVKQGNNNLLIHLAKPNARPLFSRPSEPVRLDVSNGILPDVVAIELAKGQFKIDSPLLIASLPLINASDEKLTNLQIVTQLSDGKPLRSDIDDIPAKSVVRVPFKVRAFKGEFSRNELRLLVKLVPRTDKNGDSKEAITQAELALRIKSEQSLQTHTFVSKIDASVQRYAYLPAKQNESLVRNSAEKESRPKPPRLVVQLHDAGDDCLALLAESEPVVDIHQIAPQGRGDYGFDWEDWSATDVLEAVADLRSKLALKTEPIGIAGQGMGGHGALWLAANYPDQFAAVESSNGWLNLLLSTEDSPSDPRLQSLNELLNRRSNAADLFGLISNLETTSIRLHQSKGGSPTAAAEIRELRSELGKFHADFSYQEKAITVGEQANVAAQALEEALQRQAELDLNELEFVTPDLSLQSELGWIKIDSAIQQGSPTRVRILRDSALATFRGSTENVRRLTLSLADMEEKEIIQVRLDSQQPLRIDWPTRSSIVQLERDDKGDWGLARRSQSFFRRVSKTPSRKGGMKSVFANHPLLIYGTQGTEEENEWAEAKARYDADLFRYRGTGRLDFIADREFSPQKHRDRSLILYGNFDTNSAAKRMLARSRIKVLEGRINVGPRPELGDDLAVLLVLPRRDSRTASIALVGGTGIKGMRATTRLRYFWSGVHYPDLMVFGSDAINSNEGQAPINNVRAAGYLGPQWGMQESEIIWRDVAL